MVWRTTFITISTCFLLGEVRLAPPHAGKPLTRCVGTTFTHWIADHNVLWRTPLTSEALESSIKYYSILSNSPSGMGWVYIAVGGVAMASATGRLIKGFRGDRGEIVFDGASVGELRKRVTWWINLSAVQCCWHPSHTRKSARSSPVSRCQATTPSLTPLTPLTPL
jgi:hypothetical protein